MIEPPQAPLKPPAPARIGESQGAAALPVSARMGRFLVLLGVFVCAACGLVYELELVALASYLIGDSVTQASIVLSLMVFAMGVGSLLAKRLRAHAAVGFGAIEVGLALIGGCSALALYAGFVWGGHTRLLLIAFSLAVGVLIGAEVPLLMTLIQRIRRQDAGGAVADLFAADYVGGLVGGLAFPFLLLPFFGQLTGALVTGAVNVVAGSGLVLGLFGRDLTRRSRRLLLVASLAVLAVLASAAVLVDDFERSARNALYGDEVRIAVQSDVQEIVLTGSAGSPLNLYLDGRLRVSGDGEYRYHEALVHPAMNGPHARVLVLGGGDGLAVREVLRHPGVRRVDVVELDRKVVELAREDPELTNLNEDSLHDPRVRVAQADAFDWLRSARGPYDVVVSDLPDPGITASSKLYSQEFFGLTARLLGDDGRFAVHAGPTGDGWRRAFWTVDAGVRTAGLRTTAYCAFGRPAGFGGGPDRSSASVRTPRDWGFLLAGRTRPTLGLDPSVQRRGLTRPALVQGARLAERTRVPGLPPSTLTHPRYARW